MDMMNPFDVFTVAEICAAVNKVPNTYGRIRELGIFPTKGTLTSSVVAEEKNGSLVLLSTQPQSAPAQGGKVGKRKVRTFAIPRLVYDESIKPEDVKAVRAFGSNQVEQLASLLNEKLATARSKHDITLEFMRAGALAGVVKDGAGTTIYDYFDEFTITQKTVDFVLGTSTTNIGAKCREIARHIEDNLMGDVMTGIRVLVSPEFYDKLIVHAKVEAAFAGWAAAQERIGGDLRKGFTFGGLTFEEYRGQATDAAGSTQKFIAAGDGRAFPVGTANTFSTLVGPSDFNETVGQIGQEYYAKVIPAKFDRGYEAHTQSNPLPFCTRPAVLVRAYTSN